jgi:hypothetical protein
VLFASIALTPQLALAEQGEEEGCVGRLTVRVSGDSGPVAGADVTATCSAHDDAGDSTCTAEARRTNGHGEASFTTVSCGPVQVQVIAKGWIAAGAMTHLDHAGAIVEVRLKRLEAASPQPGEQLAPSPPRIESPASESTTPGR